MILTHIGTFCIFSSKLYPYNSGIWSGFPLTSGQMPLTSSTSDWVNCDPYTGLSGRTCPWEFERKETGMGIKFKLTGKFLMGVLDGVYYGVVELFRCRYNDFGTHGQRYVLFFCFSFRVFSYFPISYQFSKVARVQIKVSFQSTVRFLILFCPAHSPSTI